MFVPTKSSLPHRNLIEVVSVCEMGLPALRSPLAVSALRSFPHAASHDHLIADWPMMLKGDHPPFLLSSHPAGLQS